MADTFEADLLWNQATRDIESEQAEFRLAQARSAVLGVWPFLAAATTAAEYHDRRALADDRIVAAIDTVASDPAIHAELYGAISAQLDSDFEALTSHREAQREAAQQVCRHGRSLEQGCQQCLGPDDWHIEGSRKQANSQAYKDGYSAGESAGSWVVDGNTSEETAAHILRGIEEGDPEVLDMQPSPLSGEWVHGSSDDPTDKGHGAKPRTASTAAVRVDCRACDGEGQVEHTETCPGCYGTGYSGDRDCPWCQGTGDRTTVEDCWVCRGSGYREASEAAKGGGSPFAREGALVNGWEVVVEPGNIRHMPGQWVYQLVDPSTGAQGASGLGGMSEESARRRGEEAANEAMAAGVSLPQGFYWWHGKAMGALGEHGPMPFATLVGWMGGPVRMDNIKAVQQLESWGLVTIEGDYDSGTVAPTAAGEPIARFYSSQFTASLRTSREQGLERVSRRHAGSSRTTSARKTASSPFPGAIFEYKGELLFVTDVYYPDDYPLGPQLEQDEVMVYVVPTSERDDEERGLKARQLILKEQEFSSNGGTLRFASVATRKTAVPSDYFDKTASVVWSDYAAGYEIEILAEPDGTFRVSWAALNDDGEPTSPSGSETFDTYADAEENATQTADHLRVEGSRKTAALWDITIREIEEGFGAVPFFEVEDRAGVRIDGQWGRTPEGHLISPPFEADEATAHALTDYEGFVRLRRLSHKQAASRKRAQTEEDDAEHRETCPEWTPQEGCSHLNDLPYDAEPFEEAMRRKYPKVSRGEVVSYRERSWDEAVREASRKANGSIWDNPEDSLYDENDSYLLIDSNGWLFGPERYSREEGLAKIEGLREAFPNRRYHLVPASERGAEWRAAPAGADWSGGRWYLSRRQTTATAGGPVRRGGKRARDDSDAWGIFDSTTKLMLYGPASRGQCEELLSDYPNGYVGQAPSYEVADPEVVMAPYSDHRPASRRAVTDGFWDTIDAQLSALRSARSADDVIDILAVEKNPYGDPGIAGPDVDGFFAGSGGDGRVEDSLLAAGWSFVWSEASYYWAMKAPDGSVITYVEGDIYRGDRKATTASRNASRRTAIDIAQLRGMVDGTMTIYDTGVDRQTANAILTVYDAASDEAKAKLEAMSVEQAASIAWKMVSTRKRAQDDDEGWTDPQLGPAIRTALDGLSDPTPQDAIRAIFQVMVDVVGGYNDSFDRELAFGVAAAKFGWDYDTLYNAWLSGSGWPGHASSRKQAGH